MSLDTTSLMLEEARSAAACVTLQLSQDAERYAELGARLRAASFNNVVTVRAAAPTTPRTTSPT